MYVRPASYSLRERTAEDNMNVALKEITCTSRDGKQTRLESIYIRGSMIR